MKQKTLCINLGYGGGCVYYANNLIKYLTVRKEVWISRYSDEPYENADRKLRVSRGLRSMLWQTLFVLPWYVLKLNVALLMRRYDRLVVFGPHNWDCVFLFVFRVWKRKAYYVVHDGIMHAGEEDRLHQLLITAGMRAATHHIFLSRNVQKMAVRQLGISRPSVIVPHGVINYASGAAEVRRLSDKPCLLMIGRINYYKGIDLLKQTFSRLNFSEIGELVIAGKFAANISRPDVSVYPKVTVVDKWLSPEEFDHYVRRCDFLLMPYLEATQSGIAAVSAGYLKPAIVSRVGAMEEQFGGAAYYIPELTPEALADTIHAAISDPGEYIRKQDALRHLSAELSWPALAGKLSDYLNSEQ